MYLCCLDSVEISFISCSIKFQDEDGNPLETEYGLCTYKDHQAFTIQV